jgi:hypothetical protein
MQNPNLTIRAMIITLIIFGLIMVVAYFARQKITNWRTYAASSVRTLSAVDGSEPRWRATRQMSVEAARSSGRADHLSAVWTEVKVVFSPEPTLLTATMIATAIPAAIKPYSMAVAPRSSLTNLSDQYFMACPFKSSPARTMPGVFLSFSYMGWSNWTQIQPLFDSNPAIQVTCDRKWLLLALNEPASRRARRGWCGSQDVLEARSGISCKILLQPLIACENVKAAKPSMQAAKRIFPRLSVSAIIRYPPHTMDSPTMLTRTLSSTDLGELGNNLISMTRPAVGLLYCPVVAQVVAARCDGNHTLNVQFEMQRRRQRQSIGMLGHGRPVVPVFSLPGTCILV